MENEIEEKYNLASNYYYGNGREQDYEKAFEFFNELANKYNNIIAKIRLAEMYFYGKGVEQNYEKAFEIFREILENKIDGYVYEDIEMYIAEMYYEGRGVEQNYKKAYEIFNKLEKEEVAKLYLVRMYYYGKGVEQNYEKAYEIFKMFIEEFHRYYEDEEDYFCTYNGEGKMTENYEKAFEIFNKLAEIYENKEAKLFIARMYYYGEYVEPYYVERNYEKAFEIFNELVEKNNDIEAKLHIARMYYKGIYLEQDYEKAYKLFNEIAEKNNDEIAKLYLFKMYYYGEGVEQNHETSQRIAEELALKLDYKKYKDEYGGEKSKIKNKYQWGKYLERNYEGIYEIILELAEIYGNENTKLNVAITYYMGNNTNENYKKAFEIFNGLVEKYNNKKAKFYIARMYYKGIYLEQDYKKAFELFNDIAEDDDTAKYYIAEMYYYGFYVKEDRKKAFELFNEIAEYDDDARSYINDMYNDTRIIEKNSISFNFWEEVMKKIFEIYDYLKELGYEDREEQQNMTMDIIQAIEDNQNIVVEAGVGIGKSYAYLIPLMLYYNKTNKPFIISTSTIALQEQLQKDIATLNSILNWNVPSIIAKGRTHYICRKKVIDSVLLQELDKDPSKIDRINYDKFTDYDWNKINVNKCEFKECEYYNSCYFIELREKIRTFQGSIICNHDLLLENQKRKNDYRRLLLPNVKFIVLDEAHNLEEKGRNSFKEDVTLQECREIINTAQKILSRFNYYNIENIEIAQNSISTIFDILEKQVEKQVQEAIQNNRIIAQNDLEICKVFNTSEIIKYSSNLYLAIQNMDIYLQSIEYGSSEDVDNLISDLEKLEDIFGHLKEIESNNIFWIDNKRKIVLNTCSKYVNEQIKEVLFDDKDSIKILTSATLNTSNKDEVLYEYFTKNIGLNINEELFLSEPKNSPFDYENHMICYCCKDITAPNGDHDNYIRDITRKILELLNITKGKTLILFTSKADMKLVYDNLKLEKLPYDLLIQKDGASQNSTKEEFKNNINSVLLSTGSFWEGIDIKGKSLSNVIIVRLPFPIPDPIIEYKCSVVENNEQVLIPEMKIKLKQGIGRLIRGKDDTGIISILDSRIERHLNKVLECIPTSNITYNIDDVKKFIIKNKIEK